MTDTNEAHRKRYILIKIYIYILKERKTKLKISFVM